MSVNFLAIVVTTIVVYIVGALWYSLLFKKQWMEITGADKRSEAEMKKMGQEAIPYYALQLVITFFQVYVVARFVGAGIDPSAFETVAWIFGGFVLPTLVGAVMWSGQKRELVWKQIFIQLGYQVVGLVIMAGILTVWQ